ncbi:tetratricopeptide (TPR) repeat protein [Paenibacillus shirakamiensis]|uniref:Tetratricopeptide (TPR) repeat protein n=1 Tax=Paenibacillus shirakamiensis TaxID=1265935 RepID=A0ABS4JCN0_9BACL|nr:hypothetical protein [Paenibacillus shirakamiensis]MBP1999473.1 tetratricopeptide (TPR) repeat protein [Paenibacillus shirakamiensis]
MENKRFVRPINNLTKPLLVLYQQSLKCKDRGDLKEAISCLESGLMSTFSTDSSQVSDTPLLAKCWLEYGRLLRADNQHAKAIFALEQCFLSPDHKREAMVFWADLLHEEGYSDCTIAERLTDKLNFASDSKEMCIEILCLIGAYETAYVYYDQEDVESLTGGLKQLYMECLVRLAKYDDALTFASKVMETGQLRQVFYDPIAMDAMLCRWEQGDEEYLNIPNHQLLSEALKRAVKLGFHRLATQIATKDDYLKCELTLHMYSEGYTQAAKYRMDTLHLDTMQDYNKPLAKELSFIKGEMYYDEEDYEIAADLFESLIDLDPLEPSYRFAAASSYLQQSARQMSSKLESSIENNIVMIERTYHYLDIITQSLYIVHRSKWHTDWGPAQRRNRQAMLQFYI